MSDGLGVGLGVGDGEDESDGLGESGGGEVDVPAGGVVGGAPLAGWECVDFDRFDDGLELGEAVPPGPMIREAGEWDVAPPGPAEPPGLVLPTVPFGP